MMCDKIIIKIVKSCLEHERHTLGRFQIAFPTRQDSPTFRDKGTEVPSLSWDKGTTGQAQNLAKGRDGPGQPVKIQDGMWDGMVQDFDSLSHPVPSRRTKWDRAEKDVLKQEKDVLKTEKDILKQERIGTEELEYH